MSTPTPTRPTADAEIVVLPATYAAFPEAVDNIPSPKADTTTSAMRLKIVFVDICFLSLVVKKTFSFTAGKEVLFAS